METYLELRDSRDRAEPISISTSPLTSAPAATPKANTGVNSEDHSSDASLAISAVASSSPSSLYGFPPVAMSVAFPIASASAKAVMGPLTV